MAEENEKKSDWSPQGVCSVISALGVTITMVLGVLNHRTGIENGEKIQAVQTEAETVKTDLHTRTEEVKRKTDDVDAKLESVKKTAEKTAKKVGAP